MEAWLLKWFRKKAAREKREAVIYLRYGSTRKRELCQRFWARFRFFRWEPQYLAYRNGGDALPQYGAAVFLVTLFSIAGLVLGILSRIEKDNYYLFPHLGIGLNVLCLAMISFILYAGI